MRRSSPWEYWRRQPSPWSCSFLRIRRLAELLDVDVRELEHAWSGRQPLSLLARRPDARRDLSYRLWTTLAPERREARSEPTAS
jgi:hypothetical protein